MENTRKDRRRLIEIFKDIDINKDKFIEYDELVREFAQRGFTSNEIKTIMSVADGDQDGKISLDEFLHTFEVFDEMREKETNV